MRILMLLTDGFGGFGGIAKFNRDFLCALDASPQVERVYAWPRLIQEPIGGPLPESVVYQREFAGSKFRYARHFLYNLLFGPAVDVVVCGHINLLPMAWLAARKQKAALALIVHGVDAWAPTKRLLTNAIARRVDMLLSVSRLTAARFAQWAGVAQERWTILPNSVDTAAFTPGPKPEELAARYGLQNRRVALTMGRMDSRERYKGFDETLEAMPELARRFPGLTYLVAGDGPDRARLQRKAEGLGLSGNVVFTGRIAEYEKIGHYRLADVYVMPSTGEGFGIVFIEAAACGVPVIGSSADGSREALLDGRLGALVDPRDGAQIVEAVSEVLRAPRPNGRNPLVETFSTGAFDARVGAWLAAARGAREITQK